MSKPEAFQAIQPEDDIETRESLEEELAKAVSRNARDLKLEREAYVRKLILSAKDAYGSLDEDHVEACLSELHWVLRSDPREHEVLDPNDSPLSREEISVYRRIADRRLAYRRALEDGEDIDPPLIPTLQELSIYIKMAKRMGILSSTEDPTRYAPVRFETLDTPGARSRVDPDDRSAVGRVRVSATSSLLIESRAVELPHRDCEHILIIANPRQGKDSTGVRLCGNLKDEHGYKWVSIYDDGRNETPCISIPNDERAIRENLEQFGQEPKGYRSRVFVPAVGVPDELPANHEVFTLGIDSLTPELIGKLAGVSPTGNTSRRIKAALDDVRDGSRNVDELIMRLEDLAEETSAEVTVSELEDDDGSGGDSYRKTYQMGEDELLRECAQALIMLASEGLLRDAGADTNLDMKEIISRNESVAILNCNHLPDGDEHLKYLLINIWLRLIYQVRDEHPRLPRVVLEAREIKALAPSKLQDVKYREIIKSLRQTLFDIASQGGSRRILLVGSTQYINDVYKPIRGNMPIKILLQMGDEKISALESAGYSFSGDEYGRLSSFQQGWGMLLTSSGKTYPINWCGARCGLGLGDLDFEERYARAAGWRLRTSVNWNHDTDQYVDVAGKIRRAPASPEEWYLLLEDLDIDELQEDSVGADVDGDLLEAALARRRDYPIPTSLRPEPTPRVDEYRELDLISTTELEDRREAEALDEYDIPPVLEPWIDEGRDKVERAIRILQALDRDSTELKSYAEISRQAGVAQSTISTYFSDMLDGCYMQRGGEYVPNSLGVDALEVKWNAIFNEIES